jgi:signal transduction histidine kinase
MNVTTPCNLLPAEAAGEADRETIRILLVDDAEDEYIVTRRILSEIADRNHRLDWASSYEEGLDQVLESRHDIYLVDYGLNGRTGLDLLRAAVAEGCTQPIILLTSREDRQVDLEAMKAGVWDYLVKGRITPAMLERTIRYTLEHKKVLDLLVSNQKQREKFAATLTHDLKTPIKAEFRIFELFLARQFGPLTEMQESVLQELTRSNRFMYQMVDNLLAAFKFEEGHLMLRMELVNINDLVESMLSLDLAALAQDKEQCLSFDLQPDLPCIPVDVLEIKRVIYNLIQNAVTYTPKGGSIRVESGFSDHEVHITVADTGPGLDETIRKTLFEPYSSSGKRYRHIGTGLGLYISKKIIDAHQGRFRVESHPSKGSRFTFSLPEQQDELVRPVTF